MALVGLRSAREGTRPAPIAAPLKNARSFSGRECPGTPTAEAGRACRALAGRRAAAHRRRSSSVAVRAANAGAGGPTGPEPAEALEGRRDFFLCRPEKRRPERAIRPVVLRRLKRHPRAMHTWSAPRNCTRTSGSWRRARRRARRASFLRARKAPPRPVRAPARRAARRDSPRARERRQGRGPVRVLQGQFFREADRFFREAGGSFRLRRRRFDSLLAVKVGVRLGTRRREVASRGGFFSSSFVVVRSRRRAERSMRLRDVRSRHRVTAFVTAFVVNGEDSERHGHGRVRRVFPRSGRLTAGRAPNRQYCPSDR